MLYINLVLGTFYFADIFTNDIVFDVTRLCLMCQLQYKVTLLTTIITDLVHVHMIQVKSEEIIINIFILLSLLLLLLLLILYYYYYIFIYSKTWHEYHNL